MSEVAADREAIRAISEAIEGSLREIERRITALEAAIAARPGLEDAIAALREGSGAFAEQMGARFAALEAQIANHEQRITKLQAGEVAAVFDAEATRQLEARLDHVDEVLRANQEGIGAFQQAIVSRIASIEALTGSDAVLATVRTLVARIERLEADWRHLEEVRERRYAEVTEALQRRDPFPVIPSTEDVVALARGMQNRATHTAIRDRGVIIGSFTWALMQARRGHKVRRAKWPDASVWASWQEILRELDICPDEDLTALDWHMVEA